MWLPPAVWFHGSQSQSTGGASPRNASTERIISWLEQSIRCVLITPFGRPVDPDVNSTFAIVSEPTRSRASSTSAVADVATSDSNGCRGNVRRGRRRRHQLHVARQHLAKGALEAGAVGREHQARLHAVEHLPQRGELLRLQRIGRRDRRVRDPDVHRGKREQPVVDAVAGQNQDRSVDGELPRDQRLRDAADLRERLGVGDAPPVASPALDGLSDRVRSG